MGDVVKHAVTVPAKRGASSTASRRSERLLERAPSAQEIREALKIPARERLRIVGELSSGGMASVEVVTDDVLQRRMARKLIHPHLQHRETTLRMFVREAQVTSRLSHPNIVPIHDIAYDADGRLYFTMKLVPGQTLAERIESFPAGPLTRDSLFEIIDVAIKVCDALAYAHSRGVLRCDVKPSNIMVGDFGQVYLMDWGVAHVLDQTSRDRNSQPLEILSGPLNIDEDQVDALVLGTPHYMSPEQAAGPRGILDARVDVFSLGAVLFEAFTRRPPYEGADTRVALAEAHLGRIPPVSALVGTNAVPPELERIIMRAVKADRSERYASIEELRADLVQFSRGDGEFPRIRVDAGHVLIAEGAEPDAAYIIVSGACEVVQSENGQPTRVRTMGPGDVFGEAAILCEERRTATVAATEPSELIVISRGVLAEEVGVLKPWLRSLLRSLAQRFRAVDGERRSAVAAAEAVRSDSQSK